MLLCHSRRCFGIPVLVIILRLHPLILFINIIYFRHCFISKHMLNLAKILLKSSKVIAVVV